MTERDNDLEAALGHLQPPPRDPEFFSRLEPELQAALDEQHKSESPDEQQSNVTPITQARKRRFILPSISVAAAVLVVALVSPSLLGNGTSGTNGTGDLAGPDQATPDVTAFRPTLASQVAQRATATYAALQGVKGHVVFVQHPYRFAGHEADNPGSTTEGDFQLRANGDYRFDTAKGDNDWNGPVMQAYRSRDGIFTRCDQEPDGAWGCSSFTGPTALDSAANPQLWDLDKMVASLRSISNDANADLTEDTLDGAPVWKLTAAFGDKPNGGAEAATIYVDQATLFPVKAETTRDGAAYTDITVTGLAVNPSFDDSVFSNYGACGCVCESTQ